MNNLSSTVSRRKLIIIFVAIFMIMGLGLGSLALAQEEPPVVAIIVNSVSDVEKKNDGKCTLREAVIAANKDKQSGGKDGECAAGTPDGPDGQGDIIVLQVADTDPDTHTDTDIFSLTRTDNGSENSSTTGDLDITSNITILTSSPGPVVIEGGEGFSDRIFHILSGSLTLDQVTIRGGNTKDFGGGIYVEGGKLELSNSTLTANHAGTSGGALYNNAIANLNYVTVKDNTVGDTDSPVDGGLINSVAVDDPDKKLTLNNSYADNNSCAGFVSGNADYNLARDSSGCNANVADDASVILKPVFAGGTPAAYKIPANSKAVDAAGAPGTVCPETDQLGLLTRPQGPHCDIGAMEFIYFIVTNTSDDIAVEGSLPWAINQANNSPGLSGIIFAINPADVCQAETISLSSALPDIVEPVIIDGTLKEDGTRCDAPYITIDGAGGPYSGFTILYTAEGSTIRDLIIRNFGENGIVIMGDANEPVGGDGSTIQGNTIHGNSGSGIVIGDFYAPSHNNYIEGNTIFNNGWADPTVTTSSGAELNDGVTIPEGVNNNLSNNNIFDNADLSVDLGADGPTPNDPGDADVGANFVQNYPELYSASLDGYVGGILNSFLDQRYALQFYSSASCLATDELTLLNETPIEVTTDSNGYAVFTELVNGTLNPGTGVRVTATDGDGNTSEYSNCVPASENNVVWTQAKLVPFEQEIRQFLGTVGEARWYKFSVEPGSEITIDLYNLPANYDFTVYKDIAQTYSQLLAANLDAEFDLYRLGAEVPTEVIASTAFAPSAYTPTAYTPTAYTPTAYTPTAYTPTAYTPTAYTPTAYTQDVIAPTAYTPTAYTPTAYTPTAYTPTAYTPNATLDVDPALYSSAQLSSLIAVSAFDNLANESVTINTWTNTGEYYVRVRGRNGAAVAEADFSLQVTSTSTDCSGVNYSSLPSDLAGANDYYYGNNSTAPNTVILVDWNRLQARFGGDPNVAGNSLHDLNLALQNLADQPEVDGVIVEIGQDGSLIKELNLEAEEAQNYACPYAKNVIAEEIKDVIGGLRDGGELEYVVIAGNDDVVPFFRVPDSALLGPESWFQPPVSVFTSSEASLRGNFVLTDDFYGAKFGVSYKDASIPVVDLAVGRLLESPADMLAQLAAYDNLTNGVANHDQFGSPQPLTSTVTGYDFLVDAVESIKTELHDGTGLAPEELITPYGVAPLDDTPFSEGGPWTADDLLDTLDNNESDIIFLAGHFSASTALAADFQTGITTTDFLGLGGDWENVIVYSAGCHAGYNIIDQHSTPFTLNPDWATAFASRGSTLIGGTGYQYGDTDFIEYSERLYLYFTQKLRADTGAPISIGQAMVAAKQQYLAETPVLRGIHQKALIEATIFGLPMLAVDMPNRLQNTPAASSMMTAPVMEVPGSTLGLRTATANFDFLPHWNGAPDPLHTIELQDTTGGSSLTTSWLSGDDGVLTNLGEPALPLFSENVSPPATDAAVGYTLRGIGFRQGNYMDMTGIPFPAGSLPVYPLIGAPTTEIRAVHLNFLSAFWFPLRTWSVNLFDNLFNGDAGDTTLFLMPAQYKTADLSSEQLPPPSTLRRFDSMNFRLYYSNYTTEAQDAGNLPGLASPPNIARVIGTPNGSSVDVEALVVGNPGAGIQEVWVTFTGESGGLHGAWQSADLAQDINDSRMWRGSFDVSGTPMEDVRFIVQACSGTGLCSLVDNVGNYFIPGADGDTVPTALTQPLSSGAFYDAVDGIDYQKVGNEVTFTATLTADFPAADVSNRPVFFGLGPESRLGITDENGTAEVTFLLVSAPGDYEVTAWFPGNANLAASTSPVLPFRIIQQTTTLILEGPSEPVTIDLPLPVTAMLKDGYSPPTLPLAEQAVLFAVFDGTLAECPVNDEAAAAAGASAYKTVFTGLLGEAPLGEMELSSGDYTVCAYFRETPSYAGSADQLLLTINSAPVANDDSYAVNFGETLDVATPGVLANDSDVDGNTLSAAVVDEPTNGTLNLNADGSFTYEITNSSGAGDSFTYQACDVPYGACDQATVTITINQPPVCEQVIALTDQGDYPTLWPTNKRETFIYLSGATDLEDDASNIALEYFFLDIMQDEETGDTYDAEILNSCTDSWVRSQRDGTGDGRVYEISYLVRDSAGAYCQGTVDIATLPHDQSGDTTAIKGDTPYSSGPLATCPLVLP